MDLLCPSFTRKTSLTAEKAEVFGQAPCSTCLMMDLGSAWKLGGDLAPDLLSDTTQMWPQPVLPPVRKGSWLQLCLCSIHMIYKTGAPWHSPPGSSELFNTEKEPNGAQWGAGKEKSSHLADSQRHISRHTKN